MCTSSSVGGPASECPGMDGGQVGADYILTSLVLLTAGRAVSTVLLRQIKVSVQPLFFLCIFAALKHGGSSRART